MTRRKTGLLRAFKDAGTSPSYRSNSNSLRGEVSMLGDSTDRHLTLTM
jgi:hypothetical protein